jgi:hypothetical protein
MFWRLADRRKLRDQREAEERLRGLLENDDRRDVYIPASVYGELGHRRVWLICREYGAEPTRRPL